MTDFQTVPGFEDVWRPPVRPRLVRPQPVLTPPEASAAIRARIMRLVSSAPEVMVKVTGRTRDGDHLLAHLNYISRRGQLALEGADGQLVAGRQEVAELAADWASAAEVDSSRRANSPMTHSVVLSMPAGTNEIALRDAAKAFAETVFGEQGHDFVMALHTDTPRPHVHLSVRSLGVDGQRLNPKKGDLEQWRQVFAEALRQRGVEAEATPRRARGLTRKSERTPLRKIRERYEAGGGPLATVQRAAYQDAAKSAFSGHRPSPWEERLVDRQQKTRGLYLTQARMMQRSTSGQDRDLGFRLEAFVRAMPAPDTQVLRLARELRDARGAGPRWQSPPERERGRC